MLPPQRAGRAERATTRSDRDSWPLPARDPLPWPTPGNEAAINSNPRLYGATRPTRTAGDGYYARAVPPIEPEEDPLAHLFPSPVPTVQLPNSHFAFADRLHEADKMYDHRADDRRKTPNWSYRTARAHVFYDDDVPHDLELPEDGSGLQYERSRSRRRSSRSGHDRGSDGRARSTSRGRRSGAADEGERGRRSGRSSSSGVLPRRRSRSASTAFEEDEPRRAGHEPRRASHEQERSVHGLEEHPLLDARRASRGDERVSRWHEGLEAARARSPSPSVSPTTAHRRALLSLNGEDDLEAAHERRASSARPRRLASFDHITSRRPSSNVARERSPLRSPIPWREWSSAGGVLLVRPSLSLSLLVTMSIADSRFCVLAGHRAVLSRRLGGMVFRDRAAKQRVVLSEEAVPPFSSELHFLS